MQNIIYTIRNYCNWRVSVTSVLVIIFVTFSDVHLFSIALSVFFFFNHCFRIFIRYLCVFFSIEINIY